MSHKKQQKKTNTDKARKSISPKSISWLTPALLVAIVSIALVCIFLIPNVSTSNDDIISETGNNLTEMAEYLMQKYDDGFSYVADANGGVSLFYSNKTGEIAVMQTETFLENANVNKALYTNKYADNGYLFANQKDVVQYYTNLLNMDLGAYRIYVLNDLPADPSTVTPATPYKDYAAAIANLSPVRVLILTDKALTEDEVSHINTKIKETGIPTMLRVAKYPADKQETATAGIILAKWSQQEVLIHENINTDFFETDIPVQ